MRKDGGDVVTVGHVEPAIPDDMSSILCVKVVDLVGNIGLSCRPASGGDQHMQHGQALGAVTCSAAHPSLPQCLPGAGREPGYTS